MLNKIQDLTGARIDIPHRTQGADGAPPDRGKSRIPVSLKGTRDAAQNDIVQLDNYLDNSYCT